MDHFYSYIAMGWDKPSALRQAKLDFLAESDPLTSHPFFWGGFVLIGDPSPIEIRRFDPRWIMALTLAGFIGLAFFLKQKFG